MKRNFALYDDNDASASTAATISLNKFSTMLEMTVVFLIPLISQLELLILMNFPTKRKEYNETMSELEDKIDEGEKLAQGGEEKLEKIEDEDEKSTLQKQLDDLKKSIEDLKKKETLGSSVVQGVGENRPNSNQTSSPKRAPASFKDKKYVSKVPRSNFKAASIKREKPRFSSGTSSSGGGSVSGSSGTAKSQVHMLMELQDTEGQLSRMEIMLEHLKQLKIKDQT